MKKKGLGRQQMKRQAPSAPPVPGARHNNGLPLPGLVFQQIKTDDFALVSVKFGNGSTFSRKYVKPRSLYDMIGPKKPWLESLGEIAYLLTLTPN